MKRNRKSNEKLEKNFFYHLWKLSRPLSNFCTIIMIYQDSTFYVIAAEVKILLFNWGLNCDQVCKNQSYPDM